MAFTVGMSPPPPGQPCACYCHLSVGITHAMLALCANYQTWEFWERVDNTNPNLKCALGKFWSYNFSGEDFSFIFSNRARNNFSDNFFFFVLWKGDFSPPFAFPLRICLIWVSWFEISSGKGSRPCLPVPVQM